LTAGIIRHRLQLPFDTACDLRRLDPGCRLGALGMLLHAQCD
jgi:hypothetical protein